MSEDIKDKQIAFACGTAPGMTPVVLLGIPSAAYAEMMTGKVHNIDLTREGVRVRLSIFEAPTFDAAKKKISDLQSGK